MSSSDFPVIPQPRRVTPGAGQFVINAQTSLRATAQADPVAQYLASSLRTPTGYPLPVQSVAGEVVSQPNTIALALTGAASASGDESYTLDVTPDGVTIQASSAAGLFYGVQTLRQLLPVEVEGSGESVPWTIPAVSIEDAPQYRWRGLHLDVGRHFFPVQFIKKFLDVMALHKLNVFHWHLTDDQGWRIEIKQYPKLTEVGARRAASPIPADRKTLDGKPYGGFYTQDEVREVIAYAQQRFITVVPEIEMPGHAVAALTSYPDLGCVGKDYQVRTFWGIADDVFCAGNEATFTFLENVLTEVLDLFPSEYIHIGGDECPKVRWEVCPKCQARIQSEGLEDEHELQSYFIRRIEQFLNAKGRRMIGWDEILEGGLAPNATVMSWRGSQGGIDAANAGHDVVMSPNTHSYLDYYQSDDHTHEPPAIGRLITLETAYEFDPTAGIPADRAGHVLGGQGNIWTEYMPTTEIVEYMAYPRASALAETMWSAADTHDYESFSQRLRPLLQRLDRLDVHYRKPF